MALPRLWPLDPGSRALVRFVARVQSPTAPGLLALRHALARGRAGFWGDDPDAPGSVLFVRAGEGEGELEAFGLGDPEPAVSWLAGRQAAVALAAPADWRGPAEERVHGCRCGTVVTWVRPPAEPARSPRAAVPVRRLAPADAAAFAAAAPEWASRGWAEFPDLVTLGAAFGVPHGDGFAALAWVFDATDRYDALATFTAPRFRRFGLARASALALLEHVRHVRRKDPLWSASADNAASLALAGSLGFVPAATETVLRWPAQTPGVLAAPARGFGMM